ncbi:MAG TPA: Ig-like domain-containing protein, partial [Phnomibacter sp.]|nr:Ig-like domain-containing protein [Phnomibacter sp.]
MKQRTFSFLLLLPVAWMLLLTLFSPGCANIVPPVGGPRDSFPPVLIKASPALNATRFDAKTITLQFDEYLQLDNLQQELIINPP